MRRRMAKSRKSSRTGARHSANAADRWLLACSNLPAAAAWIPAVFSVVNRPRSQSASATVSRYPGGALASTVCGSTPASPRRRRRLDTWVWMLARAAGTGDWPQTALINDSTPTGRLRLITSMANTARCFGGPSGTGVPFTLSCNGPKTPNSRPVPPSRYQPSSSSEASAFPL